jgi:hypothetical protein
MVLTKVYNIQSEDMPVDVNRELGRQKRLVNLKTEAICFSETSVLVTRTTWRHISVDSERSSLLQLRAKS